MTYVITEPCIGVKEGACVDVCPAGCIHTTPEAEQNYIDPDVCIECEQCVLVCPVDAIFLDTEVPQEWRQYTTVNAEFFSANKPISAIAPDQALNMVAAGHTYAARAGVAVAVVVMDAKGSILQSAAMGDCESTALELAERKAYTALAYQLGTHELRPGVTPPWARDVRVDKERVLIAGGGLPVVEGKEILGAIGVAGAPVVDQDVLCCQAALSSRSQHGH